MDTETVEPKTKSPKKYVLPVIFVLCLAAGGALFWHEHAHVSALERTQRQINAQTSSLKTAITKQDNINNGIVANVATYQDPAGKLGMMNGAVLLTLPLGWTRAAADSCDGGATIDSQVLCYDVASVSSADKKFTATVAVYDHSNTGEAAQQWDENEYDEPLSEYVIPSVADISTQPVNGNSAISYELIDDEGTPQPSYVNATYITAHGKYAVVITAQLESNGDYGTVTYDYRQTYGPLLQQFAQSVEFKN